MREIEFRAKRIDSNEWIYGSLVGIIDINEKKIYHIVDEVGIGFNIDQTTIGQYTGLKDKNGKKIFEGDVFELEDEGYFVVQWSGAGYFELQFYGFYEKCLDGNAYEEIWGELDCEPIWNYDIEKMEIKGNIYDNPELLKGE